MNPFILWLACLGITKERKETLSSFFPVSVFILRSQNSLCGIAIRYGRYFLLLPCHPEM